jgi:hypothetical protein
VVSFYDRAFHFLHDFQAFVWIRVVADDVAQADVMGAVALAGVSEDGLGRFEVRVQIAENGKPHAGGMLK